MGDSSGFMHIGAGQEVVISHQDDLDFMVDVYIYEDGLMVLPPSFTCYDINIYVWYVVTSSMIGDDITGAASELSFSACVRL